MSAGEGGLVLATDYLVRGRLAGRLRAVAVRSTDLTREAQVRHGTTPVATAALGRALAAALLLGTNPEKPEHLTLRILGDGPLGAVVADTDGRGGVRGYVQNPGVLLPLNGRGKLDVGRAVGKGILHISRDLGLREPYSGSTELRTGEIAEDLAWYLRQSEQIPSAVALGVLVNPDGTPAVAGGYLLQLLPDGRSEAEELEAKLRKMPPVTALLLEGLTPEEILRNFLREGEELELEKVEVAYRCRCSLERSRRLLVLLGAEGVREILTEDGGAELRCHFCGAVYRFDAADLAKILREMEEETGR